MTDDQNVLDDLERVLVDSAESDRDMIVNEVIMAIVDEVLDQERNIDGLQRMITGLADTLGLKPTFNEVH